MCVETSCNFRQSLTTLSVQSYQWSHLGHFGSWFTHTFPPSSSWVSALEKVVHLEIPTQSDLSPPGIPVGERKRSRSVRDDLETSVGEDKNSIEKQQSV